MNIYSSKAFRLFAALLCMLFTAPHSHARGATDEATLSSVSGPANEVIEAVNVTTQFVQREAQAETACDNDDPDPRGIEHSFAINPQPVASFSAAGLENLTIRPLGSYQSAHGTRAPPSLRKTHG